MEPRIYFWRTSAGRKVDFLVEHGNGLIPVEVKTAATPRPLMSRPIRVLREDLGDRVLPGYVIHPGNVRFPLGASVTALPFQEL